tara:strand:- start:3854 stop:4966 length:1113 start_codon:yes stop_codon:yes gene_type:complete
MSRFTSYAIREISSSFLFLVVLLTGILWMGQGLRHIDLLTSENISFLSYLSYIVLLLPKLLLLTIPVCIFLSVLIILNRFRSDSELIILWASGRSDSELLLKPILFFSFYIYIILMLLSLYITPSSLNELRHKIIEIRESGIHASLLKEKKFISPISTLTIFLQDRERNRIKGLMIHDINDQKKPQTYIAQEGEFISDENKKILRLFNGNVQLYNKEENKISEVEFETYDLDLTPYTKKEDPHIYADEMFTYRIVEKLRGKSIDEFSIHEKEEFAALHSRFINPLFIFCYALLPLLITKFSKKPDDGWVMPVAIISFIAFFTQILQITFQNLLIDNNKIIIINYAIPFVIISIIILFLYFEKGKTIQKNV